MSNGTEHSLLFHNNWVLQVQHTTALTGSPSEQPCRQGLWAPLQLPGKSSGMALELLSALSPNPDLTFVQLFQL